MVQEYKMPLNGSTYMEDERVTQPDIYIWYAVEPQLQVADIGGRGVMVHDRCTHLYLLALGSDSDTLDCLFHPAWHTPPSMITIQMIVSDRNFITPEHMITV